MGRPESVCDGCLLRAVAEGEPPVSATSDVERRVPLSDTQVNSRLADLDDDGLISSAVLGKTKVWYLDLSGHQAAESAGCDCGEQLFL